MRIHLFTNGAAYKKNKIISLLDFFFPYAKQKIDGKVYHKLRLEATTTRDPQGNISRDFYTFRAFFLHYLYELLINPAKELAESLKINPRFALQVGAIAFDANDFQLANPATSVSFAHVCTGSNGILLAGTENNSNSTDVLTTFQYNSVNMTNIESNHLDNGYDYLHYLIAPATGSHTMGVSWDGSSKTVRCHVTSFSGALQSGQPDSHAHATSASATSLAVPTTVIASNCWLVAFSGAGSNWAAGAGTTIRSNDGGGRGIADSNGVVGTGSQALNFTCNSGNISGTIASIAPAPVVAASGDTGYSFFM